MITMEFDEMKKVWDTQNNEPLYGFNEKALHNRILSKKNKARHITNITELMCIIVNAAAGSAILAMNLFGKGNVYMYLLSAWMFITAFFLLASRIRRIKTNRQFDRSMFGDLAYAISLATYQVRFSRLMQWNILPIALFILFAFWDQGKTLWVAGGTLFFLGLVSYASRWEHNIYKARKRELEILQNKLASE